MSSDKFLSLENLIGEQGQKKLANSHVCLIGLGGVGSWVAEALVRSGIGKLTLIDMDHIVASNINRQIQATEKNIGQSKLQALSDRIHKINSNCDLILIDDFLTVDNLSDLIHEGHDVIVDAIDQVQVKCALADFCSVKKNKPGYFWFCRREAESRKNQSQRFIRYLWRSIARKSKKRV